MVRATLTRHPATPADGLERIDARVDVGTSGGLAFQFTLPCDPQSLRLPPPVTPRRADELWERTCFEAFIRARDSAYYELNFAPSGEWAAYRFTGYRTGRVDAELECRPDIELAQRESGLELRAALALADLPELIGLSRLTIALAAVVENRNGARSYWALRHPAPRPDFHHPEGFVLELTPALLAGGGGAP